MKEWRKDGQTPMWELPGCIGYTWGTEFYPRSEIKILADFDWNRYRELAANYGHHNRRLSVFLSTGPISIEVGTHANIGKIIDQLPTVTVYVVHSDYGLPDGEPRSDSAYIFFLADGAKRTDFLASITALRAALDKDFKSLTDKGQQYSRR
jgi:hypothetical protein